MGVTKSCGCLVKKHGDCSNGKTSRLYNVWCGMKSRCYNTGSAEYHNYGARGIVVCDEWQNFPQFKEWAMKNGYNSNAKRSDCTLDRIDVNGNYTPNNCRWVSAKEQNRNKRNNNIVTINGIKMIFADAVKKYSVPHTTAWHRLYVQGKTAEEAFNVRNGG